MFDTCVPYHDWVTATLTGVLCIGLIVSYLPQHYRIISNKSSEGLSPWFLLLGSTGCASGMYNMLSLQWDKVKCCRVLSKYACIEMTAGIFQLFLMWFLFTIILVLYIMYYPPHLKYVSIFSRDDEQEVDDLDPFLPDKPSKTDNWRLSIILAWVVAIHFMVITFVTLSLLLTTIPQSTPSPPSLQENLSPPGEVDRQVHSWATFLGVSSAILATLQYAPQLYHTYCAKLVGALSIPMMLMQTPGTVFMVLSIAMRPGTNWTSWIMFAVSGVMQGSLLVMCIAWKFRQRSLAIDDFGKPILTENGPAFLPEAMEDDEARGSITEVDANDAEDTPLLSKERRKGRWVGRWVGGFRNLTKGSRSAWGR